MIPATGMLTFSLRNVGHGDLLGRRDDHRGIDLQLPDDREVYVARSGGQVGQQEVERPPFGLVDHLFQGADGHGAAP